MAIKLIFVVQNACSHPCIHPSMHLSMHPCMHPSIHASMHACMHASIYPCIYPSIHLSILFTLSGVQGCGCARVYPIPYLSYTLESLPIYHRCSNMKDVTMTTLIFFLKSFSHSVLLTSSLESSGCVKSTIHLAFYQSV